MVFIIFSRYESEQNEATVMERNPMTPPRLLRMNPTCSERMLCCFEMYDRSRQTALHTIVDKDRTYVDLFHRACDLVGYKAKS